MREPIPTERNTLPGRVNAATAALQAYAQATGHHSLTRAPQLEAEFVAWLLCDLMHFAHVRRVNWNNALHAAAEDYIDLEEAEPDVPKMSFDVHVLNREALNGGNEGISAVIGCEAKDAIQAALEVQAAVALQWNCDLADVICIHIDGPHR